MADLEKVTAFILRHISSRPELLLFQHPSAGIQVPAGTVEMGEEPRAAAEREAQEESGLSGLTLEADLGWVQEKPVTGDHFVAVPSVVYSRPDTTSFDWAHFRHGLTVRLLRRSGGFAQVCFSEPDRWPDPHYATYQITGWVAEDILTTTARRYFYLFQHDGNTPDSWTVSIDNHLFRPFWAPLDPLPEIIAPQAAWLAILKNHLGG